MDAYVVIAEVTVPSERLADFIAASLDDARDSVAKEPGCQQFDVLLSADGSPTVVFYEVYDDRAAFEAHLQTPHFFRWRDATQGLITDKSHQLSASTALTASAGAGWRRPLASPRHHWRDRVRPSKIFAMHGAWRPMGRGRCGRRHHSGRTAII